MGPFKSKLQRSERSNSRDSHDINFNDESQRRSLENAFKQSHTIGLEAQRFLKHSQNVDNSIMQEMQESKPNDEEFFEKLEYGTAEQKKEIVLSPSAELSFENSLHMKRSSQMTKENSMKQSRSSRWDDFMQSKNGGFFTKQQEIKSEEIAEENEMDDSLKISTLQPSQFHQTGYRSVIADDARLEMELKASVNILKEEREKIMKEQKKIKNNRNLTFIDKSDIRDRSNSTMRTIDNLIQNK